jgi:aspartate/methionine/tyrosine aminotransferase
MTPGVDTRPPAQELNDIIDRENPHLMTMLSDVGTRMYMPSGVPTRAAEASDKARHYNATIGMARDRGEPMHLPSIMNHFKDLTPDEVFPYAPVTGHSRLRSVWRDQLLKSNPSLEGKSFSLPIVTAGLTHALSIIGDLFVDKGDMVLLPDKLWENYELMFAVRHEAQLGLYPFFDVSGGFNVEALRKALATRAGSWKTILVLNFPNSPTGYSMTPKEADACTRVIYEAAESGRNLIVVVDDAYANLYYDEESVQESIFGRLAGIHERILAVKIDGPTKEHFLWGFRLGMLTFSSLATLSHDSLYGALEKKVAGAIRSSVSSCSLPAQTILAKELGQDKFTAEWEDCKRILSGRFQRAREILSSSDFADVWHPYPFNSGYFMCLKLKRLNAETFRKHLLESHGVALIAEGDRDVRVALATVDEDKLEGLFNTMAAAARELQEHAG